MIATNAPSIGDGIETMCVRGGQGMSMIIERLS